MSWRLLGPIIAIAVNLPLAVWAMARAPRNPAHRTFALFALSLVIWNLGGEVFYRGRPEETSLRLSFIGMALAPANFLALALNARRRRERGDYWLLLLYLPTLAGALLLHPVQTAVGETVPMWRSGFYYAVNARDAWLTAGFSAACLLVALGVSWRDSRADESADWMLKQVQLPLFLGALAVLGAAMLRRERAPMVSLWVMVMSQYAMFMMVRRRLVPLDVSLRRWASLTFSALALALFVLLAVMLVRPLFGRVLDQEVVLILVVGAVALCALYAAVLPQLEALFEAALRYWRRRR